MLQSPKLILRELLQVHTLFSLDSLLLFWFKKLHIFGPYIYICAPSQVWLRDVKLIYFPYYWPQTWSMNSNIGGKYFPAQFVSSLFKRVNIFWGQLSKRQVTTVAVRPRKELNSRICWKLYKGGHGWQETWCISVTWIIRKKKFIMLRQEWFQTKVEFLWFYLKPITKLSVSN